MRRKRLQRIMKNISTKQVNYIFERKSMKGVGITYRETCWIRNIIIFVESSTTKNLKIVTVVYFQEKLEGLEIAVFGI
ncbi:hypothetical protein C0J52_26403 [Blattella germanica]|nr:hypothetical protein C0J52_26403 [Blattella germanica]